MTIEINAPGTPAFYAETVVLSANFRRLVKDPACKIKNVIRNYTALSIFCAASLVLMVVLDIFTGFSTTSVTCAVFMAFLLALVLTVRIVYARAQKRMLREFRPSTLTMDENGIVWAKDGASALQTQWAGIVCVRETREGICFAAKEPMSYMLHVQKEYRDQIEAYLREARPNVLLITE